MLDKRKKKLMTQPESWRDIETYMFKYYNNMEKIKNFKEFVNSETLNEKTSMEESYDMLCEMANLSQRRTGINTRIYVSSKEGQHGPRIKVYNSSNDESFLMSIEDSPKVLIGNPNIVSNKIFKQIIK